ncbi:hypothetical protein ACFOHS_01045 [Jhaorihella thermophila]
MQGPGRTNRLDSVEAKATGYMVAFDLGRLDMGYAVGTDHPALGWSPRPPGSVRPRGMPGPDGVRSAAPLVRLGMVNPVIANRTVATFTGGFKREHGAFKYGDMATYNHGHHYGFIEKGTIFQQAAAGAVHALSPDRRHDRHEDVDGGGQRAFCRASTLPARTACRCWKPIR